MDEPSSEAVADTDPGAVDGGHASGQADAPAPLTESRRTSSRELELLLLGG